MLQPALVADTCSEMTERHGQVAQLLPEESHHPGLAPRGQCTNNLPHLLHLSPASCFAFLRCQVQQAWSLGWMLQSLQTQVTTGDHHRQPCRRLSSRTSSRRKLSGNLIYFLGLGLKGAESTWGSVEGSQVLPTGPGLLLGECRALGASQEPGVL